MWAEQPAITKSNLSKHPLLFEALEERGFTEVLA